MPKRRRFKQAISLQDRLESFAKDARDKAALLPPGAEKDELLKQAGQADTALHIEGWISSPGLQSPR